MVGGEGGPSMGNQEYDRGGVICLANRGAQYSRCTGPRRDRKVGSKHGNDRGRENVDERRGTQTCNHAKERRQRYKLLMSLKVIHVGGSVLKKVREDQLDRSEELCNLVAFEYQPRSFSLMTPKFNIWTKGGNSGIR